MTNFKIKMATGVASAAIIVGMLSQAAFAATIKVNGNGNKSTNKVTVTSTCTNTIVQGNATNVANITVVGQNTGGNTVEKNTGKGNNSVSTGNTTSTVTNTVTGGNNTATGGSCCGCAAATDIVVKNNGNKSNNTVTQTSIQTDTAIQGTITNVINGTLVLQNTGDNTVSKNTGAGDNTVETKNATSTVTNTVTGGSNTLNP